MQGLSNLGEWIDEVRAAWRVPGLAAAVVREGKAVFCEGTGFRDVEATLPATPETRFAIGSATKAFTTMAMAILVDEGALDWDTPVRHYLPSFKLWDRFAAERITPRDLVTHRSGLPRHDNLWYFSSYNRGELVERLHHLEPTWDLRTVYQYNNLMFMAAGYLVERLAGITWEDFVKSRILEPLKMSKTSSGLTNDPGFTDYALPYAERDGVVQRVPYFAKPAVGPAGSISSTASDMARWLALHLDGGRYEGGALVSEANLVEMHTPQVVIRDAGQLSPDEQLDRFDEIGFGSYGLGWRINPYRGHTVVHHAGSIDGFGALVSFMPKVGSGVAVLTNLNDTPLPYIVTFGIYDRLLGLDPVPWDQRVNAMEAAGRQAAEEARAEWSAGRKEGTQPSHPRDDYVGEFEHPAYGTITITVTDGGLFAHYGDTTFPLTHYHYDVFQLAAGLERVTAPISFFVDVHGNISRLSIPLEPTVGDIVFTRKGDR